MAQLSVPDGTGPGGEGGAGERDPWLRRFRWRQACRRSVRPEGRDKVAAGLAVLTPEEDEAVLRETGFSDVRMLYMGFVVRGV